MSVLPEYPDDKGVRLRWLTFPCGRPERKRGEPLLAKDAYGRVRDLRKGLPFMQQQAGGFGDEVPWTRVM